MTADLLVLFVHAFATVTMVGVIWTCQLVHYPLFARVGAAGYEAYQRAHMNRIAMIVGPMRPRPMAPISPAQAVPWLR